MTSTNALTTVTDGLSTTNAHSAVQPTLQHVVSTTTRDSISTTDTDSITTDAASSSTTDTITTTEPPSTSIHHTVSADDNSTSSSNMTSSYVTTDASVTTLLPGNSAASTSVQGVRKKCPDPLPIPGGKILSTGPYVADVSSAVYSCIAGLTLTGHSKIGCNITGKWNSPPPNCVAISRQDVDNNITLDDSTKVPLWMTIVLCMAFGLLCLLLIACLLMYCLKILGYCKGSTVGTKVVVRERGVENGDDYRRRVFADDFETGGKYNRPKHVSYEETDEHVKRLPDKDNVTSSRIPVRYTEQTGRMYRREAKMPSKLTWMPHMQNYRNINTSTK